VSANGNIVNFFEPLLKFRAAEEAVSMFAYNQSDGSCGQLIGVGITVRDAVTNADLEPLQAEFSINYEGRRPVRFAQLRYEYAGSYSGGYQVFADRSTVTVWATGYMEMSGTTLNLVM
jgi:hypothetical protein